MSSVSSPLVNSKSFTPKLLSIGLYDTEASRPRLNPYLPITLPRHVLLVIINQIKLIYIRVFYKPQRLTDSLESLNPYTIKVLTSKGLDKRLFDVLNTIKLVDKVEGKEALTKKLGVHLFALLNRSSEDDVYKIYKPFLCYFSVKGLEDFRSVISKGGSKDLQCIIEVVNEIVLNVYDKIGRRFNEGEIKDRKQFDSDVKILIEQLIKENNAKDKVENFGKIVSIIEKTKNKERLSIDNLALLASVLSIDQLYTLLEKYKDYKAHKKILVLECIRRMKESDDKAYGEQRKHLLSDFLTFELDDLQDIFLEIKKGSKNQLSANVDDMSKAVSIRGAQLLKKNSTWLKKDISFENAILSASEVRDEYLKKKTDEEQVKIVRSLADIKWDESNINKESITNLLVVVDSTLLAIQQKANKFTQNDNLLGVLKSESIIRSIASAELHNDPTIKALGASINKKRSALCSK